MKRDPALLGTYASEFIAASIIRVRVDPSVMSFVIQNVVRWHQPEVVELFFSINSVHWKPDPNFNVYLMGKGLNIDDYRRYGRQMILEGFGLPGESFLCELLAL